MSLHIISCRAFITHNDAPHHPLKIMKPLLRTLLRLIRDIRVVKGRLQTSGTIPQIRTSASEPNTIVKDE